jgi:hypothetical protein
MRLILNVLSVLMIVSCTTHQETSRSIDESKRILNERIEGTKKVTEARANTNSHRIMEIIIPQPKEKQPPAVVIPSVKKSPEIFEVRPKGMIREAQDDN